MQNLLPFIVTGLVTGMIYGLAGTGLVLTFKTSAIFNFGHGAILTAAAMVYYWLRFTLHWDWKIAFVATVFIAGPIFGLLMERVARTLSRQPTPMKILGTVGLTVAVPSLCLLFYPASNKGLFIDRVPGLPFSNRKEYKWRIFDINIFGDQIVIAVIAVVAVAALYALFRYTRLGATMRAAVDDPDLLDLLGTNPIGVRRVAWMIGCMFAALSGILILPLVGLQPYNLTFLAMYAFGAAAIGGFTSIPVTFLGGLMIGIVQDLIGYQVSKYHWQSLNGLSDALPFLILFIVLLVLAKNKLSPRSDAESRPPVQWHGSPRLRVGVGVFILGLLALVPNLVGGKLAYYSFGLCTAILVLSLGLLIKTSGQVSLCHATFAGIGGLAFSRLTVEAHVPWLIALPLAGLIVVPIGALVALPAIRLHGVYLALATFGFGILVTRLFFAQTWMFKIFAGGRKVPAPFGSGDAHTRYYVILAVFAVSAIAITIITQSRLGRMLRGMSGSPTAVSTLGLSTNVTKLIVFCCSAFFASIAGVMFGMQLTVIDGATTNFQPYYSLVLVAILGLAPFREPWYAIVAAISMVLPAYFDGARTPNVLNALFGTFAILIALRGGHSSMGPKLRKIFDRFQERTKSATIAVNDDDFVQYTTAPSTLGLEIENLTIDFGGLRAVNDVCLSVPVGRITGLIGPNGAGKTTTFNAVSGINRDVIGRLTFNGSDIGTRGPAARGRLGIGRTFQRMDLADELSVTDNVNLGHESALAGQNIFRQLYATSSERQRTHCSTRSALELCGITHLADHQAGELSTGERRLVELARCLAGEFDVLLLDEPSSGLDRSETLRFADVLQRVVSDRGCGILLVEHDMSLVMNVCQYIYVLDFGHLIFEGDATTVSASPLVRAAYLGSESNEVSTVVPR